jgi:hypothetical protein
MAATEISNAPPKSRYTPEPETEALMNEYAKASTGNYAVSNRNLEPCDVQAFESIGMIVLFPETVLAAAMSFLSPPCHFDADRYFVLHRHS